MWRTLCVLVCACVYLHAHSDAASVCACVREVRGHTSSGRVVHLLGVPYGAVDQHQPFGPAKPLPQFETPFSAYNDPPVCPQIVNGVPKGNIHCLHLNIYTPDNATVNSNLPVMVYVHGGAFVEGDGNFKTISPVYLVEKNVIVVTVNYRLGPYGFLCLPQLGYNNQGLKDIALALKWVKDNIKSFGGDEENIVLFGHSAGSVLVEFLLLYNEDKVFDKVILQSANIASPYMTGKPANEAYVATVAAKLGIDTNNLTIEDTMKLLSNVKTEDLINITKGDIFRPCVDDIFITKTLKKVNMNDKTIMIGNTNKETLYFYKDEVNYLNKFKDDLSKGFSALTEDDINKVKHFYLTEHVTDSVVDFGTDFAFTYPAERSARFYVANNATVYRYVFSHDGSRNYMKLRENISEAGATHADELGYLFDMDAVTVPFNHEDSVVSEVMTEMWTNFAKFGNPTPKLSNHIYHLWPKVEKESKYYIDISYASNFSIQEGPYRDRMCFWDEVYQLHGSRSKGFNFGEEYTRSSITRSRLSLEDLRNMRELILFLTKTLYRTYARFFSYY